MLQYNIEPTFLTLQEKLTNNNFIETKRKEAFGWMRLFSQQCGAIDYKNGLMSIP